MSLERSRNGLVESTSVHIHIGPDPSQQRVSVRFPSSHAPGHLILVTLEAWPWPNMAKHGQPWPLFGAVGRSVLTIVNAYPTGGKGKSALRLIIPNMLRACECCYGNHHLLFVLSFEF